MHSTRLKRWLSRLPFLVTLVAASGLVASIVVAPAATAATPYKGKTVTVAWRLASGIHSVADLRANPGAKQDKPRFGGAPDCDVDGRSYQVDVYKYDAEHKPKVDKLMGGGVLYLAPKTPNDGEVIISAYVTTPSQCKPAEPAPIVTTKKVSKEDCDGVFEANETTTINWTWDKKAWKWVKNEPIVTTSDWNKVRDLTPAEKTKLGCTQPEKPNPVVMTDKEKDKSCDLGVRTRTKTTTVDWVWDADSWKWVKGEAVVTYSDWNKVRELNPSEMAQLGCDKPNKPNPIVTTKSDSKEDCNGVYQRNETTTVAYVWNEASWKWVKGEAVVTYSDWNKVRELTSAERAKLGCDKPNRPDKVTKVIDSKQWNDCASLWRQDKIQTTGYEWSEASWSWVKGTSTISFSEAVKVRNLTKQEKLKYGCIATPPTETKTPPKEIFPAQAPTDIPDMPIWLTSNFWGYALVAGMLGMLVSFLRRRDVAYLQVR